MFRSPLPGQSEFYGQSTTVTGTTTVTVTIPAGTGIATLGVIDSILFTGQSSAAGALTITVNGVIILRKQLAATAAPEFYQVDFSAGFPQWTASNNDGTPAGSNDVVLTGPATLSNACLTVCYHYAPPSEVRN